MHTLIDCDTVFDALTRGPFPTGHELDAPVAAHLAACHECRALAEALRPAVGLFHESLDESERAGLPQYGVSPAAADSLEQRILVAASAEGLSSLPQDSGADARRWMHYVLVPLVLLVLTALAFRASSAISGLSHDDEFVANPVDGLTLLAALPLPSACFVDDGDAVMPAKNQYACCTQCHALLNPNRPAVRCVAQLTIACSACHRPTQSALGCCGDCHDLTGNVADQGPAHALRSNDGGDQSLTTACKACHEKTHSS